ncbi:MAG: hypothetical protein PVI09_13365 [Anaerolineae bacterium]|jgi:hypothetical protein
MTEKQNLEWMLEETAEPEDPRLVSRRKFLTGAVAGGAAGLAVAAGTGAAVWQVTDAEAQASLDSAQAEIERLQGLVDLYENLEKVGLDGILQAGMSALALPLTAVEQGAEVLQAGLNLIEEALLSLESALPTAQDTLLWLESQVTKVAEGISQVEEAIGNALDRATNNAVGEALRDFADMVLDNLPFGWGDRIRDVLEGLADLLTSVDDLVAGINDNILEPLRADWFSAEDGEGLGAALIDPLIEHVLDPLESHLGELAVLADTWQQEMAAPAEKAIAERAEIKDLIARYKEEHGFL